MCLKCSGTGWVIAEHKENKGVYGFRCTCGSADRKGLSQSIDKWSDYLTRIFKVQFTPTTPDIAARRANDNTVNDL
jgi:hypothetical protein